MDRGAWKAAVHGVSRSWTRLSDFTFTFHFPALQVDSLQSELPEKPKNARVGSLFLLQGNLPNLGIEPGSPALQVGSLPAELPGKHHRDTLHDFNLHIPND